jgi:hypothetical protein
MIGASMIRVELSQALGCAGLAALALMLAQCGGRSGGPGLAGLRDQLPAAAKGWRAADRGQLYDQESIFSYIDGHAEVYLAYGMKGCLARRYGGPPGEADIVLDVFEMGSPADAYGVASYDRDGESVGIGHDGRFRYGWLSFWKGSFFVSVTAESESAAARDAVLEIGRSAAALIVGDGTPPPLVGELPPDGLDAGSVRFLHSQQILNTHLWLGEGEVLGLAPDTPAVLAHYVRDGRSAHLLLVDYPDQGRAERAAAAIAGRLLAGPPGGGPALGQDGRWHGVQQRGARLAVVIGAASEELAAALLSEAGAPKGGG